MQGLIDRELVALVLLGLGIYMHAYVVFTRII